MIKNLEKRLFLIFVISVMGIFTFVFCLFVNQTIQSEQETELNSFIRTTTCLIFELESSSDFAYKLQTTEQYSDQLFLLEKTDHTIMYQSAKLHDNPAILDVFYDETKKLTEVSSTDGIQQSSQSGYFLFSVPQKGNFYGIQAHIVTRDGALFTLYTVKKTPPYLTFLMKHISFYIITWLCVFVMILILSKFLINKSMKPTKDTLQSQKEFIAAVSHELKSPLSVILTSAECIGNDSSLSLNSQKQAKVIDSECLRMSQLIQDLLLLSSIDTNIWSLNISAVDVDTLLICIFEKYEPVCRKKDLCFRLETNDEVYSPFMADKNRIEQILSILIDNAINYSLPSSEICLDAVIVKNKLVFSVIDHGIGIKDADKPFIYNRFYCADKSRTQKNHFGLGLSIAKELVKMHKGTIELSDTPGGGCTFRISFPL